ncbi:MAG: hypothetical protein JWP36_509 [Paucimonas sp.]|nr:hypothetical protein [Paucimonas sp.]
MRSHELVEHIVGVMAESRNEERVLREALYSLVSLAKSEQILVDDEMFYAAPKMPKGGAEVQMH